MPHSGGAASRRAGLSYDGVWSRHPAAAAAVPGHVADKSVWLAREFLWDALMGVRKGVTREAVEREIEAIYAPEDAAPATGDVVTA